MSSPEKMASQTSGALPRVSSSQTEVAERYNNNLSRSEILERTEKRLNDPDFKAWITATMEKHKELLDLLADS